MKLSGPNLTSPLASTPRELLIQEDLGLYVIRDKFWIGVRRVKDLGLSLGTSTGAANTYKIKNKKTKKRKSKMPQTPKI